MDIFKIHPKIGKILKETRSDCIFCFISPFRRISSPSTLPKVFLSGKNVSDIEKNLIFVFYNL